MNKQQQALKRKRKAYADTFIGDGDKPHTAAQIVLSDLKRFCRVNRGGLVISPVSKTVDPYAVMYQNGLRDAFEHIRLMLEWDIANINEDSTNVQDQADSE